jgi:hypothetical protein
MQNTARWRVRNDKHDELLGRQNAVMIDFKLLISFVLAVTNRQLEHRARR